MESAHACIVGSKVVVVETAKTAEHGEPTNKTRSILHCYATVQREREREREGEGGWIFLWCRSDRGYSSKVQQMVRQLERETPRGGGREEERGERKRYEHRNWRQVSERELERMEPVARSRYLAVSDTHLSLAGPLSLSLSLLLAV